MFCTVHNAVPVHRSTFPWSYCSATVILGEEGGGGGLHSLCNSVSPNFTNTLCYIMINRLMDVGIKIEGLND